MKSMDANVRTLTMRIAQNWQQAAGQRAKTLKSPQLPEEKTHGDGSQLTSG